MSMINRLVDQRLIIAVDQSLEANGYRNQAREISLVCCLN